MNTFVLATNSGAGSSVMMIVMLAVLFGFTYFTMIKPQKKQQQERQDMMSKLQKGDSVEMVDGLRGKIDSINDADKTVVLDADGIYLTFSRLAVRTVLKKADAAQASGEAPVKENAAEAENKETAAPVDKADADSAEDEK